MDTKQHFIKKKIILYSGKLLYTPYSELLCILQTVDYYNNLKSVCVLEASIHLIFGKYEMLLYKIYVRHINIEDSITRTEMMIKCVSHSVHILCMSTL